VAAGARADAATSARAARTVAERLGAAPLLEQIDRLARRARLDLDVEPPTTATESPLVKLRGLTAREAEVLELLARGYTNRQIADALVISVKTVSVHVSSILRKLGARSRTEAAAIADRVSAAV
jgi:DNA-binding NarL/FixJ family response regulator